MMKPHTSDKIDTKHDTSEQILEIYSVNKTICSDKVRIDFQIKNQNKSAVLWYQFDREFEQYVCDDRCDTAVVTMLLAAMKYGYSTIKTSIPISETLYYNLTYHVIPQLFVAGDRKISRIIIDAPTTTETFHGNLVATGMSRGVDSFSTMYEYGKDFPLEDYRINSFTYFQAGAHHGWDATVGHGTESNQELYIHQLERTREFCKKYGYPLIAVDSNIDSILMDQKLFKEWSFDRTHTFRNLSIAMLFQKGISKYYYSSTYTLNEFKLSLSGDMAYYERWLIPHLRTESFEAYQSNQDWRRIDKVEKLSHLEECYDYLQVCLTKTGNCGECMKCKRTLLELDALGEDTLKKFKNSFNIEEYKRNNREKWFSTLIVDKDKHNSEAHYYEEVFMCAAKNHPELLGDIIPQSGNGQTVMIPYDGVNIRDLPSLYSNVLYVSKKGDTFDYLGEAGIWVAIRSKDGKKVYVVKKFANIIH